MFNEGSLPAKFDFLWGYTEVRNYSTHVPARKYKHVISVDCADFSRIGQVSECFDDDAELLNIDHHPTNDGFGTVQLIQPDAAATVEILYDLAHELEVELSPELSTSLYTGLLTDTGGFRYSNTTAKVMAIASELLAEGVQGSSIAETVLEKLTFGQVSMIRKALATLSLDESGEIAWICVSTQDIAETGVSNEDLDGLVNYPRNIEGVEVGLLFKQRDDRTVKVSLRSAGKVDVAQIAKSLGGGGHVKAAGCTLTGTLEEAVRKMVQEVGKSLHEAGA